MASATTPLECPKGTQLESSPDGALQSCVDSVTGLKEGPEREFRPDGSLVGEGLYHVGKRHGTARAYGEDGILLGEMLYERGHLKSMNLTDVGAQRQVERENARYAAANKPARLSLIDRRTLAMEIRTETEVPLGPEGVKGILDQYRGDPAMCQFFPGLGVDALQFRIVSTQGTELNEFTLTAAECGASQSAH